MPINTTKCDYLALPVANGLASVEAKFHVVKLKNSSAQLRITYAPNNEIASAIVRVSLLMIYKKLRRTSGVNHYETSPNELHR